MAVIYGWSYADFNTAIGWDVGTEAKFDFWENYWAVRVESYCFTDSGASPRFTDANEKAEVATLINELMVIMNIYLKAESNESPMQTGFYTGPGFPDFLGIPYGVGTKHYVVLNKLRLIHSQTHARVDSIRLGVRPSMNPFKSGGMRW